MAVNRDEQNRYYTPAWVTEALCRCIEINGLVLEPCAGALGIASVLRRHGLSVTARDISPAPDVGLGDFLADPVVPSRFSWIITNPPYTIKGGAKASDFVRRALVMADRVAMLLRLSWLEPCADRADIFKEYGGPRLIVLPRVAFKGPGNNGSKTDSVTSAWMVWGCGQGVEHIYRHDIAGLAGQMDMFS